MPADFFRIMEDASGTDLDWFWQTWFYSTAHIDVGIRSVRRINITHPKPEQEKAQKRKEYEERPIASMRKEAQEKGVFYIDKHREYLKDFYSEYDQFSVTSSDIEAYDELMKDLSKEEKKLFDYNKNLTIIELENIGGGLTPVILELHFEDKTTQEIRLPAEIWRHNSKQFSKLIRSDKKIISVELDPHHELADSDKSNNRFPQEISDEPASITPPKEPPHNPMQKKQEEEKEEGDSLNDER
jgi:hypothetical protein